ncbi:putative N-formylglutamate amidohydrolase [Stella humosa]|uniref:Putative N-formylglutamate amidohydrolase n=1 Tax=Stella humosa TaxID=94 RepID=A0A3N1KLF0_9PROT|nr:N-formylglutamate amidohydrolase [Stella humosa]ROP81214.1 putative N-formylglutamate amidohydrolase [Stella humosa]BBK32561.1 N-formylglutamate amidohydrolase [Stella humosa]
MPDPQPPGLLAPDEPPAVTVDAPDGASPFLLTCDHASRRVPRRLDDLGLPASELGRHIGWDIGALVVAREVSRLLDATLFAAGYSRLVIDLNRPEAAPDRMPTTSDGTTVPGNETLTDADRAERVATLFDPYHGAIAAALDRRQAVYRPTFLACIHSFTPRMRGFDRPWHIGACHGPNPEMALLLAAALRLEQGLVVGVNDPYSCSRASDYGVPVHGDDRGIPSVLIEIRQDLITRDADAIAWGGRLARCLSAIEPDLLQSGALP